jgi:glycosyltransferase involved in cell wall biosynthesis
MLLLRLRGKPVIFDVHEDIGGSLAERTWIPRGLRTITGRVARAIVVLSSRWYYVVFAERSYPSVYPGINKFRVVCNYPDLTQFAGEAIEEKFARFSVVYVGGLTRARGMLDMLEAMKLLQESNVPVDLHLIGRLDEPELGDPSDLIAEKLLTNVKYYGYVAQPEAMKVVRKCHVGLAVLHVTNNYKGSFPTKMFEYMACGIPVITSDVPLYKSVLDVWKCGVAIRPEDPAGLAEAVKALAWNQNIAHDMGLNGRKAVEREYNWSTQAEELFALYDGIAGSTGALS